MADEEKNLEQWMEEERARLDQGFTYEPKPPSSSSRPGTADEVLAGLGIGAGVIGGTMAPHPNPVTFEGVKADVIVNALRSELPDEDTRVQIEPAGDAIVVAVLKSQEDSPYRFLPALTATLVEKQDTLTVTLSKLDQDAVRETLASMGGTVVDQGKRLLFGRRGIGGLLDAAGSLIEGASDLAEDVQDLGLPKLVWQIIDRVSGAAEEAYLEEQGRAREVQRRREAAERAWTHCPSCGRAYEAHEASRANCPSCGAPRGPKPVWLK